ncbi:MAG: preprotein translocase subunit SecE [Bacteroidales bacterium]|nr:preprotein translocase subunit SecE [Bacteroidales bacterium]MDD4760547.1 preprotein translocase subunit SecE [Bacteroidaceae bacterium]
MTKVINYFKESYEELFNKVSWPTWNELQNSAVVVSIASLIIALVVLLMDTVLNSTITQLYKLF